MRFSVSAVAFVASFAFVGAQDLQGIPTCALTCFAAAVPSSGCSLTDTKCQCTTGKDKIQSSLVSCAPQRCSADDQAKIASAVASICSRAGVTVSDLPTPTGASGSPTGASNMTSAVSGSRTSAPTGSSPAQQTNNVAGMNAVSMGVLAAGVAAAFGL